MLVTVIKETIFLKLNTTTIYSELIVKYNVYLIAILQQGTSEPVFYGDVIYKS